MGKLVRDRIPEIIREAGDDAVFRVLDDDDYVCALTDKLREETAELVAADGEDEVIGEIADVMEVLRTLAAAHGVAWTHVESVASAKRAARGGFGGKVFLEKWTTVDDVAADPTRRISDREAAE